MTLRSNFLLALLSLSSFSRSLSLSSFSPSPISPPILFLFFFFFFFFFSCFAQVLPISLTQRISVAGCNWQNGKRKTPKKEKGGRREEQHTTKTNQPSFPQPTTHLSSLCLLCDTRIDPTWVAHRANCWTQTHWKSIKTAPSSPRGKSSMFLNATEPLVEHKRAPCQWTRCV